MIDTNIIAYLLIGGDCTPRAQALYARDPDWRSEAFIMVEFSNILATYVRTRAMTPQAGDRTAGSSADVDANARKHAPWPGV